MNLSKEIENTEKAISVKKILKEVGTATLIKISEGETLEEHQSRTNALLVLLSGKAVYEEADRTVILSEVHDYVRIPEKVTHKVFGEQESLLLLVQ